VRLPWRALPESERSMLMVSINITFDVIALVVIVVSLLCSKKK